MSIIAFIPARSGSQRFKRKNYHDFYDGYNLSEIMALKCIDTNLFDRIVITSDDDYFAKCANNVGVEFFQREQKYCTAEASSDLVTEHLFNNFKCDYALKLINMNPLQTVNDIAICVKTLTTCDTVMPVNKMQKQAIFRGQPLNYDPTAPHAQTQDLEPYFQWTYSCFGHKRDVYLESRKIGLKGMLFGDVKYPEVSTQAAIAIKTKEDFDFVKTIYSMSKSS
jgi:CMP-N-acetylneuraminic acid synthetase